MAYTVALIAALFALATAGDVLRAPGKFGGPVLVQGRPGFKAAAPAFPARFGDYGYPNQGYPVAKPAVKKAVYPADAYARPVNFAYEAPKAVYPARKGYDGPFDSYGYAPNTKFAYPVKDDYDYKPAYPVKGNYQPVYPAVKKVNDPFDYPVGKRGADYRPNYDYDYRPAYPAKRVVAKGYPDNYYAPAYPKKVDIDYKPDYSPDYYKPAAVFPAKAVYPVKEVYPAKQVFPVNPVYPARKEVYPVNAGYPVKDVFPAKAVYPARAAYPVNDVFPAKAVYPANPAYPVKDVFPAKAVYPVNAAYPVRDAFPAKAVYPARAVYPAKEVNPYPGKAAAYPAPNVYGAVPAYPVKAAAPVAPVKKAVVVAKAPAASKFPSFDSFGKEFGKGLGSTAFASPFGKDAFPKFKF